MRTRRCLARSLAVLLLATSLSAASAAAAPARAPKPAPAPSLLADVELFQVSTPHSLVEFVVPWMGLSRVRGTFDDFIGTIALDRRDLTRSSVSVVIRTRSLSTGHERRDRDLRSADWFDVEKYPEARFTSREIVKDGDGYRLRGTLTLRAVTKEVDVPFNFNGRIEGPGSGIREARIGCEGRLTMDRKAWDLTGPARFNLITELGKATIGDQVEVLLALEGWRAAVPDTLPDRAADSLARRIAARGPATVAREYRELRTRTADSLMAVNEGVLNTLGYALLARGQASEALAIFDLEAEAYPGSAFAEVGRCQSHATLGRRREAIEHGEKAVALNPNALRAVEILRRVRESAPGTSPAQ